MPVLALGRTGLAVSRLGVGLAAVGRPAYITLGRATDLPGERTPDDMYGRVAEILDAAYAAGLRYVDVARSYGRAEEFLARWIAEHPNAADSLTVGSKWGYRYTAQWRRDAAVHEEKDLSAAHFRTQLAESRALLGDRLALYQIHSATAESGCLTERSLLGALVAARRSGSYRALGLTVTGPTAARALALALEARVDGEHVFDVVQATFNVLEPSLAPLLAAAHADGVGVIAKEVFANGRLTAANARDADHTVLSHLRVAANAIGGDPGALDQVALAFVLDHPFIDVALSGAATAAQLASHVRAFTLSLDDATKARLATAAEEPSVYWTTRARLPWT